jgi:hypothetical protein
MLNTLTPQEYLELQAFRRIEPDPFDLLIETLKLGFAGVCRAMGVEAKPEHFELPREGEPEGEQDLMTPDEQAAAFARFMGPGQKSKLDRFGPLPPM